MPGVFPLSLPLIKWSMDFVEACEASLFLASIEFVSSVQFEVSRGILFLIRVSLGSKLLVNHLKPFVLSFKTTLI